MWGKKSLLIYYSKKRIFNFSYLAHDEFGTRLVQAVLSSTASPPVLTALSSWVSANMSAIYKSFPAMFLALAVIQKLAALAHHQNWLELLEDLVTSTLDTEVESLPLLITASLHPVGYRLAKLIVTQVDVFLLGKLILNNLCYFR